MKEENKLRIYIWAEDSSTKDKQNLFSVMTKLNQDYNKAGWGLEYSTDFTLRPAWIKQYSPEDLVIDPKLYREKAKEIKRLYGSKYHCLLLLVKNWKTKSYHGMNVGQFFSGLQVQLCKWYNTQSSLWSLFTEEIAHSFDNIILKFAGVNINKKLGKSWDWDIIHGPTKYPAGYPKKPKVSFSFIPFYQQISNDMTKALENSYKLWKKELETKVSLLNQMVFLYKKLIFLVRELKAKKKKVV